MGLARCLAAAEIGGRKTKAKLAIKPKPYIFCVPDSAGTQGTEETKVMIAAFFEALDTVVVYRDF